MENLNSKLNLVLDKISILKLPMLSNLLLWECLPLPSIHASCKHPSVQRHHDDGRHSSEGHERTGDRILIQSVPTRQPSLVPSSLIAPAKSFRKGRLKVCYAAESVAIYLVVGVQLTEEAVPVCLVIVNPVVPCDIEVGKNPVNPSHSHVGVHFCRITG